MRYEELCTLERGQQARDLHVIDAGTFSAWRDALPRRAQTAIAANRYDPIPGAALILPGEQPEEWAAVLAVADVHLLRSWDLAAAVERLPPDSYRVRGASPGRAVLGWLLAHYRYDKHRSNPSLPSHRVLLAERETIASMMPVAQATALVRDLVNMPASELTPAALVDVASALQREFAAEMAIVRGASLAQEYPAVHAVGAAASAAPCLIDFRWGDIARPRLTLIGKGVCFDSGGLQIKSATAMTLMKKDMAGAAHALALSWLIMSFQLPVRLRLLIPAVENAISGNALRPGDVLTMRNGSTVEIGNTDAEGRLILADALSAAQQDDPSLIIDFATLTGAARIALGPDIPALFSNDDAVAQALLESAQISDDPLWRMPLWQGYNEMLRSEIADINNYNHSGTAGAITAALFLQRFVADRQAWAHVDLFGWNSVARPGRPQGGEAASLRAMWDFLQRAYGRSSGDPMFLQSNPQAGGLSI